MSLLKFRRARAVTTGVAANLEKCIRVASNGNLANGVTLGAMHHRERFCMIGNGAVVRHASSMSLSKFAHFPGNEMQKHLRKTPLPQRTTDLQWFGYKIFSNGNKEPSRRSFSFYNDPPSNYGNDGGNITMGSPAYTVYGEEIAFTLKAIPPEYRVLPSGTMILDASKRGRLLFEWTPMAGGHDDDAGGWGGGNKRYQWNASARFALTAEEAGSLLARIDRGDASVEFSRRVSGDFSPTGQGVDKVFVARAIGLESSLSDAEADGETGATKNDGISLLMDYVDPENHRFGEIPHPLPAGGSGPGAFGNEGMVSKQFRCSRPLVTVQSSEFTLFSC